MTDELSAIGGNSCRLSAVGEKKMEKDANFLPKNDYDMIRNHT